MNLRYFIGLSAFVFSGTPQWAFAQPYDYDTCESSQLAPAVPAGGLANATGTTASSSNSSFINLMTDGVPCSSLDPSGSGADRVYRVHSEITCTVTVTMDPADTDTVGTSFVNGTPGINLSIYVKDQCAATTATNCIAAPTTPQAEGGAETLSFMATAGVDYFVYVDNEGSNSEFGPYTISIGGAGCSLPVELQSFTVD